MREILFRGIHNYEDHWIYGNLVMQDDESFIYPQKSEEGMDSRDAYEVDPSTVGQFTGLNDKNGNKIFEGDIVRLTDPKEIYIPAFIETIFFKDGMWISAETENTWQDESIHRASQQKDWEFEVIGNVFENISA